MNNKKLYRSTTDSMLTGVCGGLAEYLEVDATVLRLLWVLVVVFSGIFPGVIVYIIAAVIVPLPPTAPKTEAPVETPKP
ncbi:MAG: PspC domain-containing protein [Patescibacteria group bacterium]